MHAIILGSGLSDLINHFKILERIKFDEGIDFPYVALEGHERMFYVAETDGQQFIIISGKFHVYEGHSSGEIFAPLAYILNRYEIESFVVTSASGGISEHVIIGHWMEVNSMISIPSIQFQQKMRPKRSQNNDHHSLGISQAVYAFQSGPSLGTLAEYKMLASLGADLVGMSMYPESQFFRLINIPTTFLSIPVCNYYPFTFVQEPTHAEVIQIAKNSIPKLVALFKHYLNQVKFVER